MKGESLCSKWCGGLSPGGLDGSMGRGRRPGGPKLENGGGLEGETRKRLKLGEES